MISVIIPVYNAEKTICKCIESVIHQTLIDWELLLINDGSNDDSANICECYALNDKRIKFYNKQNGGVSSARNVGLNKASGEWITFVDSDDWINANYLANLFSCIKYDVDLVVSYAEIIKDGIGEKEVYSSKLISNDCFEMMFVDNDMHWHTSPWSKLYKKSIIDDNNLRFCEGMHIGEDALFLYSYMLLSNRIYISSNTDYCYCAYVENSLTKRFNSLDSELLSYNKINEVIHEMVLEKNISNKIALKNLNWLIATYQRRILNTLYHTNVIRKKRRHILYSLDWTIYVNYIVRNSLKERIFIYLLENKFFFLYDFIRIIVSLFK